MLFYCYFDRLRYAVDCVDVDAALAFGLGEDLSGAADRRDFSVAAQVAQLRTVPLLHQLLALLQLLNLGLELICIAFVISFTFSLESTFTI